MVIASSKTNAFYDQKKKFDMRERYSYDKIMWKKDI